MTQALARPGDLAGALIRTPQELALRVRALEAQAHILSPMVEISAIAPSHAINVAVVTINPSVDDNGMGTDVYYQASIHKHEKSGKATEVSLSKTGLLKLAQAAGLTWVISQRTDDGRTPHYWAWTSQAAVMDFDGTRRLLPPGSAEIDLRDGSAQIGGWTPEKWAERVAAARAKAATLPEDERWRAKPEAIGGWTEERVMGARRFGHRLAEAKSLTAAIRNLGLRAKYSVAELAKPFVALRCSFVPDLSDPSVKRIVTEQALGASGLLYHGHRAEAPEVIDVTPAPPVKEAPDAGGAPLAGDGRPAGSAGTPAAPGPDELAGLPVVEDPAPKAEPTYHITFVGHRPATKDSPMVFVVRTKETGERDLETVEREIAVAAKRAKDAGVAVDLAYEHTQDAGREQWVLVELKPVDHPPAVDASALTVTDVQRKSGTTGDYSWTKVTISFSDGRTAVTFDPKKAEDAEAAKAGHLPVRVKLDPSQKYPDQLDVTEFGIIDTRQQTLPMGEADKL